MPPLNYYYFFQFVLFFEINHATSSNLYWSYYPHRSRELVSPVCGIFRKRNGRGLEKNTKALSKPRLLIFCFVFFLGT